MDLELKDKVAIVTGGTQGISNIRAAGGSVAAVQADVARPEDCERLVRAVVHA